ncbi:MULTISPECIES: class I adenylate-forming enzyme family protein [Nocardia]|uniref:class I adenylate-forming enzyme family protein n=1 Tax=Nocardia TaxID=1817 RepID=UPI001E4B1BD2|nr:MULTISPECIES: class I adenylate-forming enzyme family protein [Nocardia]
MSGSADHDLIDSGELHAVQGFWDLITRRAESSGDRPILFDERDHSLTFAEFRDQAERVAAALHAQGIGRDTRVAWQLPTRISTALVMAALARLGAVQAPIIPIYREREVSSAVASSAAEVILVPGIWRGTDYVAMAEGLPWSPRILTIGVDAPASPDVSSLPPVTGVAKEVRWIYFTSGSSGLPKGVRHTDRSLLAAARGFATQGQLGHVADEVGSIPFPIAHVGGVVYLMSMLSAGFPSVLLEAFDPATAVPLWRKHKVTFTGGSTVFYNALLSEQRKLPDGESLVPSLRLLKGGGAPCPPSVYTGVRDEMRVTVAHDYGMTEAPMICVAAPDDSDEQLANTEGKPVPGLRVRVVDDTGRSVVGRDGEIQLEGDTLFAGYTDPAQTAEAFTADGWFRTGDLGHVRADGHVEVTGRLKDVIIRKGENIGPVEVESLIAGHAAIAEVAVIGLPDEERGERVCAVVTLRPGAAAPELAELAGYLRQAGLMAQKVPEQLEVLDELPKTGIGKLDKKAIRRTISSD